jgi:hypothetical protein
MRGGGELPRGAAAATGGSGGQRELLTTGPARQAAQKNWIVPKSASPAPLFYTGPESPGAVVGGVPALQVRQRALCGHDAAQAARAARHGTGGGGGLMDRLRDSRS